MRKNPLTIIAAPSGAGKTSIVAEVIATIPTTTQVITCTTRKQREGEIDGQHYHFLTREQFLADIEAGMFVEYAEVYGNLYGTPVSEVNKAVESGKTPLLIVDIQGADYIMANYKGDLATVFILPPSMEELEERLEKRGTDSAEVIEKRMKIAAREIGMWRRYDHVVINDDFNQAVADMRNIILYH